MEHGSIWRDWLLSYCVSFSHSFTALSHNTQGYHPCIVCTNAMTGLQVINHQAYSMEVGPRVHYYIMGDSDTLLCI